MRFRVSLRKIQFLSLMASLFLIAPGVQAFPGNLDDDFGLGGIASTDLGIILGEGPSSESARDLAIYPEASVYGGKIMVVGNIGNIEGRVILARYNNDGGVDATFGDGGAVVTDLTDLTTAHALALQSDDKIVVVGELGVPFSGGDSFFLRYCPDGSLDDGVNCGVDGFGSGGQVFLDAPANNTDEGLSDVVLQPDGKIVAVGSGSGPSSFDFLAIRLCPNGQLDDGVNCGAGGFGSGGIVFADPSGESDEGFGVALQADDKVLIGGRADSFGVGDIGLVRLCPNGSLDDGVNCGSEEFGSGGSVTTDLGTDTDTLNKVAVQADGKIVGVGFAYDSGLGTDSSDFVVIRYCSNGAIDDGSNCGAPGFVSGDGFIIDDPSSGEEDRAQALQIQSDGKILVAGGFEDNGDDFFFLNRYLTDGSPDASFGFDGEVRQAISFSNGAEGMGIQSDGKIVLGGFGAATGGGNVNFVLIRYLGDSADLSLQIVVAPSSVTPGDPMVFTLTAANLSSVPAPQVKVSFALPPGTALVSAPGCSGDAELVCELGDLGANASATPIVVTLSSATEGVVALNATVKGGVTDPVPANDQATAFAVVSASPPPPDGDGDGDGAGDDGDSEVCDDGADNDGDGEIDCGDSDCVFSPVCEGSVGGGGCSLSAETGSSGRLLWLGLSLSLLAGLAKKRIFSDAKGNY